MFSTKNFYLFCLCVNIFLLTFVLTSGSRADSHKIVRRLAPEEYADIYETFGPTDYTNGPPMPPPSRKLPWYKRFGAATRRFFKSLGSSITRIFRLKKKDLRENEYPVAGYPLTGYPARGCMNPDGIPCSQGR